MTRAFGYKRDPYDGRDRPFAMLLGARVLDQIPASASVENASVQPKDQHATGSCTGQAWAQAVRLAYLRQGDMCPELSAAFSYFTNRAEWQGQFTDEGSYLRTGAAAAQRFGIAAESAWPFEGAKINTEPGIVAYRSAHKLRGVRSYHRVDPNPQDVRRAIANGFPVVGGFDVDQAFADYNGHGVLTAARDPLGGHALPITSYAADGTFRVLNSWGPDWGQHGYGVVDEAFIRSGHDLWVVDVGGLS